MKRTMPLRSDFKWQLQIFQKSIMRGCFRICIKVLRNRSKIVERFDKFPFDEVINQDDLDD